MRLYVGKISLYAASFVAASLFCMAVLGLANPGHAKADYATDLNCTDASTEFNVVVVARVFDFNGNLKGYANNFNFHVNGHDTWLNYRDYGPWNGTWRNTKASGHDDYKQNASGQWQWRDWKPWVPYDSNAGDMGYPSGHDQYSNETIDWMKLRSEAIRRWNNGYYTHDGLNHDFTVRMDSN